MTIGRPGRPSPHHERHHRAAAFLLAVVRLVGGDPAVGDGYPYPPRQTAYTLGSRLELSHSLRGCRVPAVSALAIHHTATADGDHAGRQDADVGGSTRLQHRER